MEPDQVSNQGPLTYKSGALPIALRGPAYLMGATRPGLFNGKKISCISGINKLFHNFQVSGHVGPTGLMANLH